MKSLNTVVFFVTAMLMLTHQSMYVHAQRTPLFGSIPVVSVSIALESDPVPASQKPRIVLTIKNPSNQTILLASGSHLFRVHVDGKDGEPTKTEWYRHLHGEFHSGDGPMLEDGPVVGIPIAPQSSVQQIFDLTRFYNLRLSGTYTVYLEVYDQSGPQDGSGKWLRTNTVEFEIATASS